MFVRSVSVAFAVLGCAAAPAPPSLSTAPSTPNAPHAASPPTAVASERAQPTTTTAAAAPVSSESSTPGEPPGQATASRDYETPLLDEASLTRAARAACAASLASGRPLLLEFSAPWCEDCVLLERMKGSAPLASEIKGWELFAINIGGGFEHPALMRAYRVNAIAKLVSVRPQNCAEPLTTWLQSNARTLEGLHERKDRASEELAQWLRSERERLARPRGAR